MGAKHTKHHAAQPTLFSRNMDVLHEAAVTLFDTHLAHPRHGYRSNMRADIVFPQVLRTALSLFWLEPHTRSVFADACVRHKGARSELTQIMLSDEVNTIVWL